MPVIKSENWDGVTAPALPATWISSGGIITSTSHAQSAPNSLKDPTTGPNTIYWPTNDGNNGQQTVSAKIYNANAFSVYWLVGRITSVPVATCYALKFNTDLYPFQLVVRIAGVETVLATIGTTGGGGDYPDVNLYWGELAAGTNPNPDIIRARVQRATDNFWLNSSAIWVSDPLTIGFGDGTGSTYCMTVVDNTPGRPSNVQGFAGMRFASNGGSGSEVFIDDWLYSALPVPVYTDMNLQRGIRGLQRGFSRGSV